MRRNVEGATTKRPVPVNGIGWLFVVGGAAAFAFYLNELRGSAFRGENVWIFVVEVVADKAEAFTDKNVRTPAPRARVRLTKPIRS
ncbi:MAG TPA: hypothetical protein VFA90_02235 [Terriglobales bacterium]|nr:hypothetical protein [Terriglobales bacterium]